MNYRHHHINLLCLLTVLGLSAMLCACSAGPAPLPALAGRAVAYTALYGSSADGVTLRRTADGLELTLAGVPAGGAFLRVSLPQGTTLGAQQWSNDAQVLHLAAPVPGGAEVGAVPLPGYSGGAVTARLALVPSAHQASMPPTGSGNVIPDLSVSDAGAGQVTLAWTQINAGDYNFDGFVNVADLVPLAAHYRPDLRPPGRGRGPAQRVLDRRQRRWPAGAGGPDRHRRQLLRLHPWLQH